ncbi:hypothetical protein BDV97DRAFT_364772 [Delphinella strobiligena]|nr:hypothetical protein BDV97DRAFT_364772 [Delphinella strobiligena]
MRARFITILSCKRIFKPRWLSSIGLCTCRSTALDHSLKVAHFSQIGKPASSVSSNRTGNEHDMCPALLELRILNFSLLLPTRWIRKHESLYPTTCLQINKEIPKKTPRLYTRTGDTNCPTPASNLLTGSSTRDIQHDINSIHKGRKSPFSHHENLFTCFQPYSPLP